MSVLSLTDMSDVVERPLLSRAELIASVDPAASVSDRTFRRLQFEGLITRGVSVHPRAGSRAKGTVVLFSTLNRDALALHRRGHDKEARQVQGDAAALEAQVGSLFKGDEYAVWVKRLGEADDQDPVRDFARHWPNEALDLARQTSLARRHRMGLFNMLGLLLHTGKVNSLHDAFAEVVSDQNEQMLVPRADLRRAGLDFEGAQVLVRMEELARGRLLFVEPALSFDQPAISSPEGEGTEDGGLPPTLRLARTPLSTEAGRRLQELLGTDSRVRIAAPLPIAAR